ncbi:MAG: diguanylate cyclase [Burkholderiales bacterium]
MNALEVFRKALQELAERHAQELPRKLAEIEALWDASVEAGGDRARLLSLQRLAHGLDVASSMLGLPQFSGPARQLSRILAGVAARHTTPDADDSARIASILADLHSASDALAQAKAGAVPHATPPVATITDLPSTKTESSSPTAPQADIAAAESDLQPPPAATPPASPRESRSNGSAAHSHELPAGTLLPPQEPRVLYLLENDTQSAASLSMQLGRFGYATRVVGTHEELISALSERAPYAMLVDVDLAGDGFYAAQALASLGNSALSRVPLLFLSNRSDVQARLESVRAGAMAYFLKPVRVAELVDKLDNLATRDTPEPYRVMIVDSDHDRADLCRAILHEVGMDVALVRDPTDLVSSLGDFNSELLLIALKLPQCGGDELAQVVHQIPSYVSLPVVFLSEQWNLDRQIGLMNVGGDALLPLPLQASQLISTVIARVERYRTLSSLMQHDSLTGLLNHSRLQQYLEIEVLRALRQSHPLSFAMIDIDHFKSVNDQFGHPVGDRILKNLARFLRQQLRKSDIVGRYGGEEFAVVLTDTDGPSALAVMEKLCADFSRIEHDTDDAALTVTFSVGVAAMVGPTSARELVLAADRALYEAKRAGRNRVVLIKEPRA